MDRTHLGLKSRLASQRVTPSLPHLGGNLCVLPLEIVFAIFDELFLGTGHSGLCALRSLILTSESGARTVSTYLQRRIPSEYLHNVHWIPFPQEDEPLDPIALGIEDIPIDGCPDAGPDLITSTILEDCPQCFDWLRKKFAGLYCESCNQCGWSFAAIAAHAGAARMLEYFLINTNGADGNSVLLLGCEANLFSVEHGTPLQVLAEQRDLQKFERCFDVIEPFFLESDTVYHEFEGPIGQAMFEFEDLLTICTFATPSLAKRLERLGAPLYDIQRPSGTSWHAAVQNGPEFLDYVRDNTMMPPIHQDHQGDTPLRTAIRANRVDSVLWLSKYTEAQDFLWDEFYPAALEVAVQLTSKESELCLQLLLPPYAGFKMDPFSTAHLLRTLAQETRQAALTAAVQIYIDQDAYQGIRDEFEDRAIRKCRLILQNSRINYLARAKHDRGERRSVRRWEEYRILRQARQEAWLGGFGRLACAMQRVYE